MIWTQASATAPDRLFITINLPFIILVDQSLTQTFGIFIFLDLILPSEVKVLRNNVGYNHEEITDKSQ